MKALVAAALCAAMVTTPALAQDVYRWVDEDGVVHYSDAPRDGAEKVEVREPQTYSGRDALSPVTAREAAAPVVEGTPGPGYAAVRIVAPEHDSVAWNTGGDVPVRVMVEPALDTEAGHQVVVYLNGKPVPGTPTSATAITMTGVTRGTYTVSAAVTAADGTRLAESGAVTFHVRQTSLQNPQRRR